MTRKRRQAGKKNSQTELVKVHWARNFCIIAVLLCCIALIAYHSLNIYENTMEYQFPALESVVGYQVDETNYVLEDPEEHELVFSIPEESTRAFYLYFKDMIGKDTPVSLKLYDGEQVIKTIQTTIPGVDNYVAFIFGNVITSKIVISIDGDFILDSAATQHLYIREDGAKSSLMQKMIIILVIFLLIAAWAAKRQIVEVCISNILTNSKEGLMKRWENRKTAAITSLYLVSSIICGNVLWSLLEKPCLNTSWSWTRNNLLFGSMLGVLVYLLIRYLLNRKMKFQNLYLYCGLIMGTVLAIILPLHLNVSWDDQIHYQNAVAFSHIHSGQISLSESDYYQSCFFPQLKQYGSQDLGAMSEVLNDRDSNVTASYESGYQKALTFIVYLPVSLALFFAKGLGIPMSICIIIGRMASVWFFVLMIFLGMRHLKSGKMIMAAASMVPICLFVTSNYNYDYWLVGLVSYSIAYLIGEYQSPDKKLTIKDLLFIFVPFLLGSVVKPVYVALLGLTAFLPKKKFQSQKFYRGYCGFFIAMVVCAIAGFAILIFGGGLGIGDVRGGQEINAPMQIQYIITHPWEYTKVLLGFLKQYLSWDNIKSYLVDTAYIPRKEWLGMPVIIWLLLVSIFDRNKEENRQISWLMKLSILPFAFISACIVATSMYVVFTPVGEAGIYGCQGRYMLPVLFPFLIVLSRIHFLTIPQSEQIKRWIEGISMGVTLIFAGIMMSIFV